MTELTLSTRLRMQVAMGAIDKFTPELMLETVALLERAQRVEDMLVDARGVLTDLSGRTLEDIEDFIGQIDEVLK